jgi:tetratricopeptide (TPR) repeat protein
VSDPSADRLLSYAESEFGRLHFGWAPIRSIRDGTWKYIDAPEPELYELPKDRAETANQQQARPETARALARALADVADSKRPRPPADADDRSAADPDTAARLRSLGYVSGQMTLTAGSQGADPKREIRRYVAYVDAFNEAMALLEAGRARAAEPRFRSLARSFPLAFEPHQYLARALAARGDHAGAVRELDLAIHLSPREAVLYFDSARTLAAARQFDAAFARVDEGLRREPSSFYGWLSRGLVARAAGQTSVAADAFRRALAINPTLAVAHLELGKIAEERGDRQTAQNEYRQAVADDGTLSEARSALDRVSR